MIIDCHCHAGQGEGLLDHWSTAAPLDAYLRRGRQGLTARLFLPRVTPIMPKPMLVWQESWPSMGTA